jgi:hypothetical protein
MIQPGASDTQAVRATFVIDPEGVLRAMVYYPMTNGRSVDEIHRLLVALQTSDTHKVATPENWHPGEDVIVPPRRPPRPPRPAWPRATTPPTGISPPARCDAFGQAERISHETQPPLPLRPFSPPPRHWPSRASPVPISSKAGMRYGRYRNR